MNIDLDTLATIATTLATSSTELDGTSKKTPDSIDAGTVTPSVLAILSVVLDGAGQLVVGLAASADAVTEAAKKYKEQDDTIADTIILETWKLG
ncbi:hypothetical protein ACWDYH_24370 [Nocardia goodfellowii]|uniref:Excreted virulence factor EspC (Type VII ESX diderm) n=1 Tax=Nocardia goodfellowii TaxID=882446 RepID=A0ABS4QGK4_9NOCA|nr:hypothetical protein [Nocardia goodfellowii]MBP2190836.1 hypothetical protein [Nocardia goodfellowii]